MNSVFCLPNKKKKRSWNYDVQRETAKKEFFLLNNNKNNLISELIDSLKNIKKQNVPAFQISKIKKILFQSVKNFVLFLIF